MAGSGFWRLSLFAQRFFVLLALSQLETIDIWPFNCNR